MKELCLKASVTSFFTSFNEENGGIIQFVIWSYWKDKEAILNYELQFNRKCKKVVVPKYVWWVNSFIDYWLGDSSSEQSSSGGKKK